jgi:dienelactone hydrolase
VTATPVRNVAERNGYACEPFAAAGATHDVYRGGDGPAVLLLHEMPSFSWRTVLLANRVRDHGYRMVMPILVGGVRDAPGTGVRGAVSLAADFGQSLWRLCVSREFVALFQHRTSPVTDYLMELARVEAAASGSPKVGVIGMCLSGGFALAAAIEPVVAVAVASQPALPFAVGPLQLIPGQAADLGLSDADRARLLDRTTDPEFCVLAFRYEKDVIAPKARVERIKRELGNAATLTFIPGHGHPVLSDATDGTPHEGARMDLDNALRAVVAALDARLKA